MTPELEKIAQAIRRLPSRPRVTAWLYHFQPPLRGHEFARVSVLRVLGKWDATIHPCDYHGITDYSTEIASLSGSNDPSDVLGYAGYNAI
jgi:hypothetical protein